MYARAAQSFVEQTVQPIGDEDGGEEGEEDDEDRVVMMWASPLVAPRWAPRSALPVTLWPRC